ncbi:MAG: replication initiator protein A [Chloroflexi bacterium]|nr:replication initiator protein A [Chloroflexota bacterium]
MAATAVRKASVSNESASIESASGTQAVLAVVEMNLEEYPAFRLGRRSRRPELRYERSRTEPDGRTFQQTWIVRGAEGLGLPGPFEQDLYVALLVMFTEQGLPADGRIRFTRNRLTQVMGCSNSGRGYELLEQGLARLAGATVLTEHAFYLPAPLGAGGVRSGPAERLSLVFHILEEVRVYERRASVVSSDDGAEPRDDDPGRTVRPRVERARPTELAVARLGLPLVQSYERRYTKGLDATFYFSLSRPLSKRLYRYLDKVRNGRGAFEIGIRTLADVLGLEYRYPSDIKHGLAEAHEELQQTGYLGSCGYAPLAGGPQAGEKVVYGFEAAFDRRSRRRAGAWGTRIRDRGSGVGERGDDVAMPARPAELSTGTSTAPAAPTRSTAARASEAWAAAPVTALQLELESFGMTPARAAALATTYPDAHVAARIAYVRDMMGRAGGKALKNPAGFLAKAIEEGYVVPETPRRQVAGVASAASLASPDVPVESSPGVQNGDGDSTVTDERWVRLTELLKARLSGATYASWVLPAYPARLKQVQSAKCKVQSEDTCEAHLGIGLGDQARQENQADHPLTVVVPSAFALDRWRRPPIAPVLDEAAAALGMTVELRTATDVQA